jgi:hypothetical protein
MRKDMHKVIVECYRENRGPEKHGRRANLSWDDQPVRQGMHAAHVNRTFFGEKLGPLRRWLQSNVGRPWDKVYGEACEVIRPDSVVRNHIKVHLLEMVQRHTFLRDGEVWCFREDPFFGETLELPVAKACTARMPFYVDPRSRLLRRVVRAPRRRLLDAQARLLAEARSQQKRLAETTRWLVEDRLLFRHAGLWFACAMTSWGRDHRPRRHDLNLRREISSSEADDLYGRRAVCVAKRQLSAKELRAHGLANLPADLDAPPTGRPFSPAAANPR